MAFTRSRVRSPSAPRGAKWLTEHENERFLAMRVCSFDYLPNHIVPQQLNVWRDEETSRSIRGTRFNMQ